MASPWTNRNVTVTSSAAALLAVGNRPTTKPSEMHIMNESAGLMRLTLDGTTPTASVGIPVPQYAEVVLQGPDDMPSVWTDVIAWSAASITVSVTWKGGK